MQEYHSHMDYTPHMKLIKVYQKTSIHYLLCSFSLSLGLSITVAAANEKIAMIGHLLAPIGWGLLPGLLLHFTLILTGKEKS